MNTWPPPTVSPFPPPQVAVTWPRLRHQLHRFFAWCDRRKVAKLNRFFVEAQNKAWRDQYEAWWFDHGWQEGADTPTVAYIKHRNAQR